MSCELLLLIFAMRCDGPMYISRLHLYILIYSGYEVKVSRQRLQGILAYEAVDY